MKTEEKNMSKQSRDRWEQQQNLRVVDSLPKDVVVAQPEDPSARCGEGRDLVKLSMLISPEVATAWLERFRNPLNRRWSDARVEMYAADIKAGHWHRNGQTISYDRRGVQADGEQRLRACVRAGCPFISDVVFNVEPLGIDRGRGRSVVDERRMRGEKTSRLYVACVKLVSVLHERAHDEAWAGSFSDDQVAAIEQKYHREADWLRGNTSNRDYQAPVYAALAFASTLYPAETSSFLSQLLMKEDVGPQCRAFLRQWKDMESAGTENQRQIALVTLQAMRNLVGGVAGNFIKGSDETLRWWQSQARARGAL